MEEMGVVVVAEIGLANNGDGEGEGKNGKGNEGEGEGMGNLSADGY